jgi:hypothetical protein
MNIEAKGSLYSRRSFLLKGLGAGAGILASHWFGENLKPLMPSVTAQEPDYPPQAYLPLAMGSEQFLPPLSTSPNKGVALGRSFGTPEALAELGVSWTYNYAFTPSFLEQYAAKGISYIPMIDGRNNPSDEAVVDLFSQNPGALVFLFNEPDNPRQSPVVVNDAVELFRYYLDLVGPGKIILGNTTGLDCFTGWLDEFVSLYKSQYGGPPPVYGYGGHAYAEDCAVLYKWKNGNCAGWNLEVYLDWLQSFADQVRRWGPSSAKPVFSEIGTLYPENELSGCGEINPERVMRRSIPWLEARNYWYAVYATRSKVPICEDCCCDLLAYPNYDLSELGKVYRQLP